jgi:hypothetical protein
MSKFSGSKFYVKSQLKYNDSSNISVYICAPNPHCLLSFHTSKIFVKNLCFGFEDKNCSVLGLLRLIKLWKKYRSIENNVVVQFSKTGVTIVTCSKVVCVEKFRKIRPRGTRSHDSWRR